MNTKVTVQNMKKNTCNWSFVCLVNAIHDLCRYGFNLESSLLIYKKQFFAYVYIYFKLLLRIQHIFYRFIEHIVPLLFPWWTNFQLLDKHKIRCHWLLSMENRFIQAFLFCCIATRLLERKRNFYFILNNCLNRRLSKVYMHYNIYAHKLALN